MTEFRRSRDQHARAMDSLGLACALLALINSGASLLFGVAPDIAFPLIVAASALFVGAFIYQVKTWLRRRRWERDVLKPTLARGRASRTARVDAPTEKGADHG